jgi:hypothetical protein
MIEDKQLNDIKETLKKACRDLLEVQEDIEGEHLPSASFYIGSIYNGLKNLQKRLNIFDEDEA